VIWQVVVGCACLLGGILAVLRARQIAPAVNQQRIEQLQRSVLSPKAVEEQTEMYRRPEQVHLTMWLVRFFGGWMVLIGGVLLVKSITG
jgi:hypothetical protein